MIFGCEINDIQDENLEKINYAESQPPKLDDNGRIKFANLESFNEFFEENIYEDPEELRFFDNEFRSYYKLSKTKKINGSTSLRETGEPDFDEDEAIHDPFTASIVNENRELVIEDKVVRYTKFGTIVFDDRLTERVDEFLESFDKDKLDQIYANHDFKEEAFYELDPGIFLFGVPDEPEEEIQIKQFDTSNLVWLPGHAPEDFNFIGCNRTSDVRIDFDEYDHWTGGIRKTAYTYFESNRRMKAKAWSTNYVTHSSGGFNTRLQRRRFGVWWASDADIVSVSVRADCYYPHLSIAGIYYPFHISPNHPSGIDDHQNNNKATVNWGFMTAVIGGTVNQQTIVDCDPDNDFTEDLRDILADENFYCKPKWKAAKRVKIKKSESCHFVKRGGHEGEIRIYINKEGV